MLQPLKNWFSRSRSRAAIDERLEKLRQKAPVPLIWLFGKTQSGKTSIVRFLTRANDAEIGQGFRACTRFSRKYSFPTEQAPLVRFLDTRGVDEPNYDPAEDLARFNQQAHLVVVTVKALDHAQGNMLEHLRVIRRAQPLRPIILALTCLHEAYPQQQHPAEYPFGTGRELQDVPEELARTIAEQKRRFGDLVDHVVPIDLTRLEEGFAEANYGGKRLQEVVIAALPAAYRQTLLTLEEAGTDLRDAYSNRVLPHILGYSTLAATAGAFPIPWVDLLILPAIQTQMIYHLARLYGQPLSAARFTELASTLGLGMLLRQAARELMKFIPYVGSVAGGVLGAASTFALGKAFCYYYSAVHQGHVPTAEELKRYYHQQLVLAQQKWALGGGD
jgi:uncharacterized protein (DUF697 family)/predicted GTPase